MKKKINFEWDKNINFGINGFKTKFIEAYNVNLLD